MTNTKPNVLLSALTKADHDLLRPHLTPVRLLQQDVLQEADSPVRHAYFPNEGVISLLATFETGQTVEIAAIGREGAIGTKVGIRPQLSFAKAIVQLPGTAFKIDVLKFQEAAQKSLAITQLATCANEVIATNLQQTAGCNALHGVERRLARWLLHASDRYEMDDLPLTHEFLSQMLGVRRTTVSLAAHALQDAGVIAYKRASIQITDRAKLEAISCECYQAVRRNVELIAAAAKAAGKPNNNAD